MGEYRPEVSPRLERSMQAVRGSSAENSCLTSVIIRPRREYQCCERYDIARLELAQQQRSLRRRRARSRNVADREQKHASIPSNRRRSGSNCTLESGHEAPGDAPPKSAAQ